jgi:hypothetical protein
LKGEMLRGLSLISATVSSSLLLRSGGTINRNHFGVVHRLTEQGTATTVAAFPAPLGRHFNSELSERA